MLDMQVIPTRSKRNIEKSIGTKYGRLLVLHFSHSIFDEKRSRNHYYVDCLCDCGTHKMCELVSIKCGKVQSCGCLQKEAASRIGRESVIKRTKYMPQEANAREVYKANYSDGDLSFEEFMKLSLMPCSYCGVTPSNKCSIRRKNVLNSAFIYQGLDRVDNNLPHNLANLVPCCWFCNQAKSTRTVKEFEDWIITLYNYLNLCDKI